MLYGPQNGYFDLVFELPAECARSLEGGSAALGLVPIIEIFRQNLEVASDVCISSDGPVRSIYLLHRKALREIRSVALDSSSRTSVALMRILLAERYGVKPVEHQASPDVSAMLAHADAAVLIGDPALKLNLTGGDFERLDLGEEWKRLTGLPMVYAAWAGRSGQVPETAGSTFRNSYEWGKSHLWEIIEKESERRGLPAALAADYLTQRIRYELDGNARNGMRDFERLARVHGLL